MLLVIDAGNTNITIGAYQGDELTFTSRLATDHHATRDRIAVDLASIFKLHEIDKHSFSGAIISSVVPEISRALKQAVEKVTGQTPVLVGPGVARIAPEVVGIGVFARNERLLAVCQRVPSVFRRRALRVRLVRSILDVNRVDQRGDFIRRLLVGRRRRDAAGARISVGSTIANAGNRQNKTNRQNRKRSFSHVANLFCRKK